MLAIVASDAWPSAARRIGLTAVVMVVIVGVTRVYLGAHWSPTCSAGARWRRLGLPGRRRLDRVAQEAVKAIADDQPVAITGDNPTSTSRARKL